MSIKNIMFAIVAMCALALPAFADKPATKEAATKPQTVEVDPFCPVGPDEPKPEPKKAPAATKTCWDGKKVTSWSDCRPYDQCWDGKTYKFKNQCPPKPKIVEKKSVQCWDGSEAPSLDQCSKYVCADGTKVANPGMCKQAPAPAPETKVQCWDGSTASAKEQCPKVYCPSLKTMVADPSMCKEEAKPPVTTTRVQCWDGSEASSLEQCPKYVCPDTQHVVASPMMCEKQDPPPISTPPPEEKKPEPAPGPSLFDAKNLYLSLEAFAGGKLGLPYIVGPEGQPAEHVVRPFGVGLLGIPKLSAGLQSEDMIVGITGFAAPFTVLEFAHDDDLQLQPYPGFMAGGGLTIQGRPYDNLSVGADVQAVFHATNYDIGTGENTLSSWALLAGPSVGWTIMRLDGIGRIELNGSLLFGYEQAWIRVNDLPTQYPGTFSVMPSIGLGFKFGGATKPADTGYRE